MAHVKGTDIVGLRKLFKERGENVETEFRRQLTPEMDALYASLLPATWVPIQDWLRLCTIATRILFPNDPEPWFSFGKAMAEKSYSTIYRVFLRVPSVKYVISRAATIWNTYYDSGTARAISRGPKQIELAVDDFPELPREFRDAVRGHMTVLLEMTGARASSISSDYSNPHSWRWQLSWH